MRDAAFTPSVTVVIPVYNGADYLSQAIDSALGQSYPKIEVLVVNDGSNDEGATEKIAAGYGDKIRYVAKPNGGVASALNEGIRRMSGDYLSWLSHDDVYHLTKVEAQVEYLRTLSDRNVLVYSDYERIDHESVQLEICRLTPPPPRAVVSAIVHDSFIHGCTILAPRKCIQECGAFNEDLQTTQDYDLWFRLAQEHDFHHIPEVLVKSRIHANQCSRTLSDVQWRESESYFLKSMEALDLLDASRFLNGSKRIFFVRLAMSLVRRKFLRCAGKALLYALSTSGK